MVENRSSTSAQRIDGDKVQYTNSKTQTFNEKDFISVYNDNFVGNLKQMQDQKQQLETQREEMLEESGEELQTLTNLLGINSEEGDGVYEVEQGAISEDTFQKHQQLQQIKDQLQQIDQAIADRREQIDSLRPVAEKIAEEYEDLEVETL